MIKSFASSLPPQGYDGLNFKATDEPKLAQKPVITFSGPGIFCLPYPFLVSVGPS